MQKQHWVLRRLSTLAIYPRNTASFWIHHVGPACAVFALLIGTNAWIAGACDYLYVIMKCQQLQMSRAHPRGGCQPLGFLAVVSLPASLCVVFLHSPSPSWGWFWFLSAFLFWLPFWMCSFHPAKKKTQKTNKKNPTEPYFLFSKLAPRRCSSNPATSPETRWSGILFLYICSIPKGQWLRQECKPRYLQQAFGSHSTLPVTLVAREIVIFYDFCESSALNSSWSWPFEI